MRYLIAFIFFLFTISQIVAQTSNNAGLSGLGSKLQRNQLSKQNLLSQKNNIITDNAETGWFWQYPKPQGNTLRDLYVFNKDTATAVGDIGTVIKTTNGGTSWDVQHHAGGTSANLYSVHFTDALTGWTAGFDGTVNSSILKTTDGGINWVEVKPDTSYPIYAVWFVDADTGFVFGDDGNLSRTTDRGKSWINKNMDDYIGAYLDVFSLNAVAFTSKDTGWVVGYGYYGNEIYKTTDCGRTWQWNQQIISPIDFHPLHDIDFLGKNNGFIVGDGGAFIKTTDGGNTWQSDSIDVDGYSVFFTDSLNGIIIGIGFDENISILKTNDGGKNWFKLDSTQFTNDAPVKVRFSDINNGWMVGGTGIIYRTTDGGNNWITQREDKHNFNSIYFVDANTGWAVGGLIGYFESEGDSGIILHTSDGGANWERQIVSYNLVINSVYAFDNQNVIAVGEETKGGHTTNSTILSAILRTTDGGQTWYTQLDTLGVLNSISFPSRNIGYAVGKYILKTTDGGLTWHIQSNLTNLKQIQFVDENTGWICVSGDTALLKTTNGGKTWKSQLIDPNFNTYSFHFINAEMGWAAGVGHDPITYYQDRYIFKTTNSGDTWFQGSNSIPGVYSSIYFINELTGWAMGAINSNGANGVIIKTTDGGNTWLNQECPSASTISNLFILDESTGWAVGDGIFKTSDGGGFVSVKEKNNNTNIPKQVTLFQNYPNPFNPSTMINYQLPMISYVTLKIYDILGREVKSLINGLQQAGTHSINFNGSKMASGVYFYRLQINNNKGFYAETKKMLLIR